MGNEGAAMAGIVLEPGTAALSGGLALVIGLAGGLLPAVAAARLRTVDALRVIG